MAVRSSIITVTDEATLIAIASDTDFDQTRRDVAIKNISDTTVYLGGSDVTAANGYPLTAGTGLTFEDVHYASLPYATTDTGDATIAVLEVGV